MTRTEWTVLIADDEPAARRGVRQLLAAFPEFGVLAECRNGAEVLAALDASHPDVVFLDIQMPGIDGFEVIRRRTFERMPAVVLLTAYEEFAIRAFEAQVLDYLVKPVTEARFAATMKRLMRQLGTPANPSESIVVTTSRGATILRVPEIDWIEAADNYARLWIGSRSYLLREPLNVLEQRARQFGFIRAHRGALIRVGSIKELNATTEGGLVTVLASGAKIHISRRRRPAFVAAVKTLGNLRAGTP